MNLFADTLAQVMQLHARYCDAAMRKDTQAFADCFSEHVEWRHPGVIMRGHADVIAAIERTFANSKLLYIQFDTPILNIDDQGQISARTHMNERCAWRNSHTETIIGRYFERYERTGSSLRFSWRLWQGLYRGPPELSGAIYDANGYGRPPAMPGPDEVPDPAIVMQAHMRGAT